MARPLKPFVRSGGYYPSAKYTPLVYPGGYTTLNAKNGKPEPINTFLGKIARFLAKRSLPMVKLEANFTPIQDLHGQESPYPPGGGKNKLPLPQEGTVNGVTLTHNADGSLTIKGTASGNTYFDFFAGNFDSTAFAGYKLTSTGASDANVSFRISDSSRASIQSVQSGGTMTIADNGSGLYLALRISTGTALPTAGYTLYPMLSENGGDFAPFANICPISGHTGCEVVRDGKNLCDPSKFDESHVTVSDGVYTFNRSGYVANLYSGQNGSAHVIPAEIIPNLPYLKQGTYVWSTKYISGGNFASIYAVDENGNRTSVSTTNIESDTYASYKFTLTEPSRICICRTSSSNPSVFSEPQLEIGETRTAFEPYQGTTVSISFGSTVYGGKLTVFEDGSGQVVADEVHFSSSVGNAYSHEVLGNYTRYLWRTGEIANYPNYNKTPKCNVAAYEANYTKDSLHFYVDSSPTGLNLFVFLPNNTDSSLPIEVVYELATPVTIPLTASQINTLVGENVVWVNDSDSISVTAYGTEIV